MSTYATVQNIYQYFGIANTRRVANVDAITDTDNIESTITSRIQMALDNAQEEIDNHLRECLYIVPITDPIPLRIRRLCCELAYIELFDTRHNNDGISVDIFQRLRAEIQTLWSDIASRRYRLPLRRTCIIPEIVNTSYKERVITSGEYKYPYDGQYLFQLQRF